MFSPILRLLPRDNSFQATDELLAAVVRALIVGLLIGTEARLLHAHERSATCRDQRPNDDALLTAVFLNERIIAESLTEADYYPKVGQPSVIWERHIAACNGVFRDLSRNGRVCTAGENRGLVPPFAPTSQLQRVTYSELQSKLCNGRSSSRRHSKF
jgi:hypothetical protein